MSDTKTVEEFIQKIKKYPCLWDVNSISYRDMYRKEAAWEKIALDCRISNVRDAKCQWKRLRDSHREALRRRRIAKNIRPWKYEKTMQFLLQQDKKEPQKDIAKEEVAIKLENSNIFEVVEDCENFDTKPDHSDKSDHRQYFQSDDALRSLFVCMYEKTRALPKHLQLRVEREVFDSVVKAEEEALAYHMNARSSEEFDDVSFEYTDLCDVSMQNSED